MDISDNREAKYLSYLINFVLNYLLIWYFIIYIRSIVHPFNHEPHEKKYEKKFIELDSYELYITLDLANAIKNFVVVKM